MPTFLYLYEQYKFHAKLSWALKDVLTSRSGAGFAPLLWYFVHYSRPLGHLAGPVLRIVTAKSGESSGSVVESLTRDGGATGSSFTSVTALCPWARHITPSLVLVQPRTTRPHITDRLLMGRKESNKRTAESARYSFCGKGRSKLN